MRRLAAGLLTALPAMLATLALSACNRLAGTEVGNPEVTVAARFAVLDTSAAADIPSMNLKVMGMGYTMSSGGGDSGVCWNAPNGHMVDFAADAANPLPPVTIHEGEWSKAELLLQSATTAESLPDSVPFQAWSNPRYAKLMRINGPDTLRALFDMPQGMRLRLMFGKDRVTRWRSGDTVMVKVMFDAGKWTNGLDPRGSFQSRKDGNHVSYVLFSATENSAVWASLKDRFPTAFSADTAAME